MAKPSWRLIVAALFLWATLLSSTELGAVDCPQQWTCVERRDDCVAAGNAFEIYDSCDDCGCPYYCSDGARTQVRLVHGRRHLDEPTLAVQLARSIPTSA